MGCAEGPRHYPYGGERRGLIPQQNSPHAGTLVAPCSALPTMGCSVFLPTSWEGTAGSRHAGGSDLAAPLATSCCVFTCIRKVSSPIVLRWSESERLSLPLPAGAVLWREASGETPGLKVVLQLRWGLRLSCQRSRSWEWREQAGARRSGWQDPHSAFISLLLPSLPKGQVKKTGLFFQRKPHQKTPNCT